MILPEDVYDLINLLIEHYGEDYIDSYETLSELLRSEFDLEISPDELSRMKDITTYIDISLTLQNCGIEL